MQIESVQDFENVISTLKDAIFLNVKNKDIQKHILNAGYESKGLFITRQWYELSNKQYLQVKCDSCEKWIRVTEIRNECCGDYNDRCDSTWSSISATCCEFGDNDPMCDDDYASGKIYFYSDDNVENGKIRFQSIYIPTSTFLICKTGYPYKQNNCRKGSFRKWGKKQIE